MQPAFPGQPFEPTAQQWNRINDAARRLPPKQKSRRRSENFHWNHDFVWVKNTTTENLRKFDVLKAEEFFISPEDDPIGFTERVVLKGEEPTANCQFAVLLQPAIAGDLVPALVTGKVQARINKTEASIVPCFKVGVKSGSFTLHQLATGSAEAIACEAGTGEKWAFLKLAQHREVLCRTVAPITKGTFGECVAYWGDFPSEFPAGESIVGINRFGNIGAEKWCIATWLLNHWYIKAAEC